MIVRARGFATPLLVIACVLAGPASATEKSENEAAGTADTTKSIYPHGGSVGVYGGRHTVPWAERPGEDQSRSHYSGGITIRF